MSDIVQQEVLCLKRFKSPFPSGSARFPQSPLHGLRRGSKMFIDMTKLLADDK
jgi:hypothetical protein